MDDLLDTVSSRELTEWMQLFAIHYEEQERARHGDLVVHDGKRSVEDDEDEEA